MNEIKEYAQNGNKAKENLVKEIRGKELVEYVASKERYNKKLNLEIK